MLWELKRSLQINQLPITCKIVPDWLPLSLDSTQVSCSELSTNDGPSRNLFEYTALAKCKTLVSHFWEITSGNCMRTRTKAPAKRSQHFNATCRNIVGRNMLRAGRVATCWMLLPQI